MDQENLRQTKSVIIEIWGKEVATLTEAGEVYAQAHIMGDIDREKKIIEFVKYDPVFAVNFAYEVLLTVAQKYSDYDHESPEWNFFENAGDELTDELVTMLIEGMDQAVAGETDAKYLYVMAQKAGELVSMTMEGGTLLYFAQEHLTATNAREERTVETVDRIVECMKRCQVEGVSFWDFCAEADQS